MKPLTLHLKKQYFDQIKSGEKTLEYRLVTDYWKKRLEDRDYNGIILLCGYPKRGDESKTIRCLWCGCHITKIIHPQFGADPVDVFAIDVSKKYEGCYQ